PIHIWHAFYDEAYGIALDEALRLIGEGLIAPTAQVFQAPGGSTTRKDIFKMYHHYAYRLGQAEEEATLEPAYIVDKNGHILPYVTFKGGRLTLSSSALNALDAVSIQRFA
ncbi:MAG: AccI family restriction endonuclease, partial [Chloroflexota bacterium]